MTPRTLADCRFNVGYPVIERHSSGRIRGAVLAYAIGIVGALVLVHWWST